MRRIFALAAAFILCAGARSGLAQEGDQAPAGDAARGKTLYHADGCWECHGTEGQGGGFSGPRIGPMALPWQSFLMQLRTPRDNMPPYEAKVLPDGDAANIYAFLKSIPNPPAVGSIAILH